MKNTILTIALLCPLLTFGQIIKKDKQYHFYAGAVVGVTTNIISQKLNLSKSETIALSLITGVAVGCAKEFYDGVSRRGNVEFKDALATGAGSLFSSVTLSYTINLKPKKQK